MESKQENKEEIYNRLIKLEKEVEKLKIVLNLESDKTYFFISRQAAIAGKVSFIVDGKNLGGVIRIDVSGEDLDIWLEQQTWHEGRNQIPRYTGDELAMRNDGEPSEWFDKRGRPTINLDED